MAKDPAFLFYPNDFDCKTKFFTDEQVGIYLRLLIAQFQYGRLSEKQFNYICKTYDNDIMMKFDKDENGFYYNERLESEIHKRKKYSESRKNNRNNKNKNISLSYDNHMYKHMENENENEIENVNKNELVLKGKYYKNSDILNLPDQYYKSIKEKSKLNGFDITTQMIDTLFDSFKIENLTGDKWYNNDNEVFRHFSNWVKNQKIIKQKPDEIREYINRFDSDING